MIQSFHSRRALSKKLLHLRCGPKLHKTLVSVRVSVTLTLHGVTEHEEHKARGELVAHHPREDAGRGNAQRREWVAAHNNHDDQSYFRDADKLKEPVTEGTDVIVST